jgi:hypothetical protein
MRSEKGSTRDVGHTMWTFVRRLIQPQTQPPLCAICQTRPAEVGWQTNPHGQIYGRCRQCSSDDEMRSRKEV